MVSEMPSKKAAIANVIAECELCDRRIRVHPLQFPPFLCEECGNEEDLSGGEELCFE